MVDLVVSPLSFAPTKVGYKQYVKAGGAMQFASFQVFERRTKAQILWDKKDRLLSAMLSAYDQAYLALKDCDADNYIMYIDISEIRREQHETVCQEMANLNLFQSVHENKQNAFS